MTRPADLRPLATIAAKMFPYNVWAHFCLAPCIFEGLFPPLPHPEN